MIRTAIVILVVAALAVPTAAAQERDTVVAADSLVTFDFQDADLRIVVAALAQVAGLNIVYGTLPSRTVTLRTARPVPIGEVRGLLEELVRANGLQLTEERGVIRLSAPETEQRPAGEPRPAAARAQAGERLWVYELKYAQADLVAGTLQALFRIESRSPLGAGDAGPEALSEALRRQQEAPFREEQPAAPPAAQAPAGLAAGLTGPVDIVPDLVNNALLIRANERDYETLVAAIQQLDTRPPQVMIEVLIAEVRRSKDFALGIDATVPIERDSTTIVKLVGRSAGDLMLTVLGIGSVRAEVVLQALAAAGDVTILSRPIVLAQNNQQARILVGDQRPFIQLFRALPTDAAVRDQVVQYRNVGTQLSIRPTVNADGYVSLTVLQEVSTATAESQFGAPVINTREVQTQLLVNDGHTVVLGGLIDHQTDKTNSGVPLLKDIPLLGLFFRSTSHRTVANELFILLTPHVLRTDEDLQDATRRLQESTRELKKRLGTPSLLAPPDSVPADSVRADTARARRDTVPPDPTRR